MRLSSVLSVYNVFLECRKPIHSKLDKVKFFIFIYCVFLVKSAGGRGFFRIRINVKSGQGYIPLVLASISDIYMFREIIIREEYGRVTKRAKKLIYDIGGNSGYATAYFRSIFPGAKVYAFEPDPRAAEIFMQNHEGDENVTLENVAISNSSGEVDFYLDCRYTSSSSLIHRGEGVKKYTVKAKALDDVIEEYNHDCIDLLKVDIEGYEDMLFSSFKKLPLVVEFVIEFHPEIAATSLEGFLLYFQDYRVDVKKQNDGKYILHGVRVGVSE